MDRADSRNSNLVETTRVEVLSDGVLPSTRALLSIRSGHKCGCNAGTARNGSSSAGSWTPIPSDRRQLPLGPTQVFLSASECFVFRGPDDPPLDNVHMENSCMPSCGDR